MYETPSNPLGTCFDGGGERKVNAVQTLQASLGTPKQRGDEVMMTKNDFTTETVTHLRPVVVLVVKSGALSAYQP